MFKSIKVFFYVCSFTMAVKKCMIVIFFWGKLSFIAATNRSERLEPAIWFCVVQLVVWERREGARSSDCKTVNEWTYKTFQISRQIEYGPAFLSVWYCQGLASDKKNRKLRWYFLNHILLLETALWSYNGEINHQAFSFLIQYKIRVKTIN